MSGEGRRSCGRAWVAVLLWGLSISTTHAQFKSGNQSVVLSLPTVSQRVSVSQRLGLTDIEITYHRPMVKGRKIWGGLVPYDEVWRAGANDNTTIRFGDAVMIEGKELPAGTYGLHMIPGRDEWTIIFSRNSSSWGSFSYDSAEDALRVRVKPVAGELREALTYEFDDLAPSAATITLQWERLVVPFRVAVDADAITLSSLRRQLRHLPGYSAEAWNDAATYCLDHNVDLDEALQWAEHAVKMEERFENLHTKSLVLAALGRAEEARAAMELALAKGTAEQLHTYARQLLAAGSSQEAVRVFRLNSERHGDVWFVHGGLARGYSALGDYAAATREMKLALKMAPLNQKESLTRLLARLEAGQDINKPQG